MDESPSRAASGAGEGRPVLAESAGAEEAKEGDCCSLCRRDRSSPYLGLVSGTRATSLASCGMTRRCARPVLRPALERGEQENQTKEERQKKK